MFLQLQRYNADCLYLYVWNTCVTDMLSTNCASLQLFIIVNFDGQQIVSHIPQWATHTKVLYIKYLSHSLTISQQHITNQYALVCVFWNIWWNRRGENWRMISQSQSEKVKYNQRQSKIVRDNNRQSRDNQQIIKYNQTQ